MELRSTGDPSGFHTSTVMGVGYRLSCPKKGRGRHLKRLQKAKCVGSMRDR